MCNISGSGPMEEAEEPYKESLANTGMGQPAKDSRIAIEALLIKEMLGLTDEETV